MPFAQGAAQRRLEPRRPGAEAFALPKTQHPGQIFRAEDNAVGVVVQTLGGVRYIQRKAVPDARRLPHIWGRLAHSTRKRTALPSTVSTISTALTRPAV
ncbi:MAG: hypothetical protein ACLTGJ_06750 [Faecalibacterium prausnitzii]